MLSIVATPIGNLKDITVRALEVLEKADLILVEDTRTAGNFLKSLKIPKKSILSFYEHNEDERIPQIIAQLKEGREIVLLSGAGTPLISDPGFRLARACVKEGLRFTSLPGPSAALNALVLAGFPSDSFLFLGFLPKRKSKRDKKLENVKGLASTLILFESPYRLVKTLKDLKQALGDKPCAICREMTKVYEEVIRGSLSRVIEALSDRKIKGECTIVVEAK